MIPLHFDNTCGEPHRMGCGNQIPVNPGASNCRIESESRPRFNVDKSTPVVSDFKKGCQGTGRLEFKFVKVGSDLADGVPTD